MESSKAVHCLKAFSNLPKAITFERTNESTGYVIHIDGIKYESDKKQVRTVATKLCLTVKEDAESVTIE